MKSDNRRPPLFVVGMNGSGTTMMLSHLGQHSEVYAFPQETYVLPSYIRNEHKYGDLQDDRNYKRLYRDISASFVFRRKDVPDLKQAWPILSRTNRSAAAVFDFIMHHFASMHGKHLWAEKTPMHVLHMTMLAEAFPRSRFIHMIRDGRDCAASDHRRWGRHPEGTIHRWKNAVQQGRQQGRTIGSRYLELRYEQVTQNPEFHLREACAFLGLDYEESVLVTKNPRTHVTGQESRMIVARTGSAYFDDQALLRLEKIAGKTLAFLGYATNNATGDYDGNAWRRGWWTIHDTIRVGSRHLTRMYTTQKNMTWALLFKRWRTIVSSKVANLAAKKGR